MTSPEYTEGEAEQAPEGHASKLEADQYEVLGAHDVDLEPPDYRPVAPGDVFDGIELAHLADPFTGLVMVVGHPCSLRRGLKLQADIPVAPVAAPAIPTAQHPHADRVLPVGKLIPAGSTANRVVHLTRMTTVPAQSLLIANRCARLSDAGIVALQQRVVGNQIRVKVPPKIIAAHCRGPLTELELWTDWRERWLDSGRELAESDEAFDAFMREPSGFEALSWRDALGEHEHARSRALGAMRAALTAALGPPT